MCTRLIYLQTCDILEIASSLRCSNKNNITHLSVVSSRQRSVMIGEDVKEKD